MEVGRICYWSLVIAADQRDTSSEHNRPHPRPFPCQRVQLPHEKKQNKSQDEDAVTIATAKENQAEEPNNPIDPPDDRKGQNPKHCPEVGRSLCCGLLGERANRCGCKPKQRHNTDESKIGRTGLTNGIALCEIFFHRPPLKALDTMSSRKK